MRRLLLLFSTILLVLIGSALFAQERIISGKVTSSEDGSGIPGANVLLKGTTIGSITDVEGRYSFAVPGEGILVFSFVGYITQEVEISGRNTIDIQLLSDATQLKEVVVTGYGDPQDKRKFTGSVSQLDSKIIENVPVATFDQMLQGRAPGVMISAVSGQPGTAAIRPARA